MSNPRTDPVYNMLKPWENAFIREMQKTLSQKIMDIISKRMAQPRPDFSPGGQLYGRIDNPDKFPQL